MDSSVASSGFDNVTIFVRYGNNSSANQLSYAMGIGSNSRMVTVDDFDSDNRLDIVVAKFGAKNTVILFGNGNSSFLGQTKIETSSSRPLCG